MNDQEFREQMIEGMTELRTNLRRLVGEDGSSGEIKSMQDDIADLKLSRARDRGFAAAISLCVSAAGLGLGKLLGK